MYERAPKEVTVSFEHFEKSGFGTQPVWWAFVAEVDGLVQGFALYYVRFSTWKGQRMYLEDLVVTEEMRGKGLGKLLFEELMAEARRTDRAAERRIQRQLRRGRGTITPSKPAVAGVDSRRTGAYASARVFVSEYKKGTIQTAGLSNAAAGL